MKTKLYGMVLGITTMMSLLTSCASTKFVEKDIGAANTPSVKVGLFLDRGCRGNGTWQWARLLAHCPQLDLTFLDAQDIRDGKLNGLQLLVFPGGASKTQFAALKPAGVEQVKQFIENGGGYIGICAGSVNAMNRKGRIGLLPYDSIANAPGKLADLAVEFNEDNAKLLDIKPGRHIIRYNGGNVMKPTEPTDNMGDAKVLAVFKSSVSSYGRAPYNFMDTPAVILGRYGKGNVLASSVHPESYESTHDIALGYIKAVSGVKPVLRHPPKNIRPLRVGWLSLACIGPQAAREMLSLDNEPAFDVDIFNLHEINEGRLRHYDVVVMPDGSEISYKNLMNNEFQSKQILDFLERGGRIVAAGNGAKYLPVHQNIQILPVGEPFAKAIGK
ncbi:MAG: hypothetical protein IKP58_04990 [Victivallales bacterium]|nr:hypothetical protein [Victivallales bacterium]